MRWSVWNLWCFPSSSVPSGKPAPGLHFQGCLIRDSSAQGSLFFISSERAERTTGKWVQPPMTASRNLREVGGGGRKLKASRPLPPLPTCGWRSLGAASSSLSCSSEWAGATEEVRGGMAAASNAGREVDLATWIGGGGQGRRKWVRLVTPDRPAFLWKPTPSCHHCISPRGGEIDPTHPNGNIETIERKHENIKSGLRLG